jgi:hypothetical protein
MTAHVRDILTREAAGDVPDRWVECVDISVAPDGRHAAALLIYNTRATPYEAQAFFWREDGEWMLAGEAYDLGAGEYYIGPVGYPFDCGTAPEGTSVAVVAAGDAEARFPVVNGHYFAVFWDRPVADPATMPDSDVPRLVRFE